jgi:NADPH-dependent 2,4-dienoyl-CoA reductase/sulfur reductase-like enzyme
VTRPARVLIVGGSAAGMTVADALTRLGFDGEVTVLESETREPYDRPPLSKQVLEGTWTDAEARLFPPQRLHSIKAQRVPGARAAQLDVAASVVTTEDGRKFPYDQLVIATGSAPRRLPGDALQGVHVLRTRDDAARLRKAIIERGSLTIVGAGFIGLEVAATARRLGAKVTVVEPTSSPLATRLGSDTASRLLALHAAQGVEFRTGVAVRRFCTDSTGTVLAGLELDDGSAIETDAALIAIGGAPVTDWLTDSGLHLDGGVVCDSTCRAAPTIWAAGDVARWWHEGIHELVRIEHRQHATQQALAVARGITGSAMPFMPTPYFWTDQYDVRIQVAGWLESDAQFSVADGSPDGSAFILHARSPATDRRAVIGWNAPKTFTQHRRDLAAHGAVRNEEGSLT